MSWTEKDIDTEVECEIEGVKYMDMIVKVYLPNGQIIIGHQLVCGHLYARFSMLPDMFEKSEMTLNFITDMESE